ncbi:MAG: FdhF/YdeP family oxidoreductase [Verrucomicrobia bacterium]|nr:FdhF/YdeP family oxidoreductase [Verrucomicrobiota bacterium]
MPGAQPPVELDGLRIEQPSAAAAGLKAVLNTAAFAWGHMGVARGTSALLKVNQKDGFDCQSCAWPSPDEHRHTFEFCENGAKALADEGMRGKVGADFFRQHSIADLLEKSDYWLNQQGRLTEPMIRREGATHYEPISWPQAFALIGQELKSLASPWEAAFYTSGRASNEAAFLWQLFARLYGNNNLPDCSNMCHESSGKALIDSIGIGKGCVTLDDFEKTELVLIIGQNPGTNHPRMLSSLEAAKANGAKIVSINPLPEVGSNRFKNPQDFMNPLKAVPTLLGKGTGLSDLWLQVRVHGDMALLKGVMKEMHAAEQAQPGSVFDHEFIAQHTTGLDALLADLEATSWERIERDSGVSRAKIAELAQLCIRSKRIIACWAMGLTQAPKSVQTIQAVMNLLLLGGNIGRPGAGPCPVRGHSNVQGDRTVGINERPPKAFLDKLGKEFGFTPPEQHGVGVVDCIKAMHAGKIKVFVALGGSFLSATPDTEFTAQALTRTDLTAHVATKLNRGHLITGKVGLILPCLGRSEIDRQASGPQFVTVEDSMGVINRSQGHLEPASPHLLSEPAIAAAIAKATLDGKGGLDWDGFVANYDRIRDRIERVIPGFEDYNARVRREVFYLPNAPRDQRKWNNAAGKAKFAVHELPDITQEKGELIMMTIRTHDQFNTTVYGLDDRYRGVFNGRRVIFLNKDDMRELGLQAGQLVDITSHFRGLKRVAHRFQVTPYDVTKGACATYFPEANVLVPIDSKADESHTPTSKFVRVTLAPSPDTRTGAAAILREARETQRSGAQLAPA